ncbi:MAG: FAD-containing monooxygenase EthA [Chloroflexi bacterium]|nr:FAD-containing monooxygenase EthA [Chloroflexota bacterium]|tara:strand:- start:2160 stop:3635 length:1476 start_codon:yes stop_codon:yes gene_type:complete
MKKEIENFDVIIVGAGIAGITTAYYLQNERPKSSYLILESLDNYGGTWYTHKYPGIRSDSDLYTFGFKFKPWTSAPIATADEILKYLGETIKENQIDEHIRYNHKIIEAEWSSKKKSWILKAELSDTKKIIYFSCNFLMMCQGYFRHNEGYTPKWKDMDKFKGQIVHTEEWPENLDYKNKSIILIGSGATAATTVPAMASKANHVTMLQRSPTFYRTSTIGTEEFVERLNKFSDDEKWTYGIVRQQILINQEIFIRRCIEEPEVVKDELINEVRKILGPDYDIEKHFTPSYRPWQQRITLTSNGDLFKSIASGKVSVFTDEIDKFTSNGILLKSGSEITGDIVATATGFNMNILGDIQFTIDNKKLHLEHTVTYRGMMFTTVPNLLWVFGYFRGAWTLRAELLARFLSRLLTHMDNLDVKKVTVALREEDKKMKLLPWIADEEFNPGYLSRVMTKMPKSGDKPEWVHNQNYWYEKDIIPAINLDGEEFLYE